MSSRRSARISAITDSTKAPPAGLIKTDDDYVTTNGSTRNESHAAAATASAQPTKSSQHTKRKAGAAPTSTTSTTSEAADRAAMPPPATPSPNKRRRKMDTATSPLQPAPPLTPTPSAVSIMAAGQARSPSVTSKKRTARPADPHATNALLRTPTGSRVLAYPDSQAAPTGTASPSAGAASQARTAAASQDVVALNLPGSTTDTLLRDACAHLCAVDGRGTLRHVIARHTCRMFTPEGLQEEINPFASLVGSICAQQVSGAAASAIRGKFVGLFDGPGAGPVDGRPETYFPRPADVAARSIEKLRGAGLSQRKAEYIKGLAEKFRDGELSAEMLCRASDDEVMEKLVAVRGLGRWSVEMFACFALKRMDVFSTGDLGVQRGMAAYMGRDVAKLKNKGGKWKYMSEQEMIEISDQFRPYRTLFMWLMWRMEDSATETTAISGD